MTIALAALLMAAASAPPPAPADTATRIAALVNRYRAAHALPPVAYSPALTAVAEAHVRDLMANAPDRRRDARGRECSPHSWSASPQWRGICYVDDDASARAMWSKPREIAGYRGDGFEIALYHSDGIDAAVALETWRESGAHDDVIRERDVWAGSQWQAMGVAAYGPYAVVWFGKLPDIAQIARR